MNTVSPNYQGPAGRRYFERHRQGDGAAYGAKVARSFQPYVLPHHRLLDFGCGAGWILAAIDAREKVGIEVNPDAVAFARGIGLDVRPTLSEVGDSHFDVVISVHALEHTLDPYSELCSLRRVLIPNGLLVLRLPISDWRVERDPHSPDANHHLYTWTPLLIANLLREAGFTTDLAKIVNNGGAGRFTSTLARRLPERAYDALSGITAVVRRRRELHVVAQRDR